MMAKELGVIVAVISVLLTGASSAGAQQSENVIVLLPALGNQPEFGDRLIFTGGPLTMVDISGCGGGSYPLQNAVLVDPGSRRGSGPVTVITVSQETPVPPGSRAVSISFDAACTVGGIQYNRYLVTID